MGSQNNSQTSNEEQKEQKTVKRVTKTTSIKNTNQLYKYPESYQKLYEHKGFKDNKASLWHWNVNGVNAVLTKGNLQQFFDQADADVVCLNEIKIDDEKIQKIGLKDYIPRQYKYQYWNCCKIKKGYSGTALISRVEPLSIQYDLGIEKHDQEGRSITAEFQDFIIVAVYVPNSGDGLRRLDYRVNEWDRDFHDHLVKLKQEKKKPVILAGDLNVAHNEIDLYDPVGRDFCACFTPQERNSFGSLLKRGFIDTFRHLYPKVQKYSFWTARRNLRASDRGWRLDYFVISSEDIGIVEESSIHNEFYGSDHCPIQLKLDLSKVSKQQNEEMDDTLDLNTSEMKKILQEVVEDEESEQKNS